MYSITERNTKDEILTAAAEYSETTDRQIKRLENRQACLIACLVLVSLKVLSLEVANWVF